MLYLHDENNQRFTFCSALGYNTKTGNCILAKSEKSIFDKCGPGIGLYFMKLKFLMVFFFLAALISAAMIYINVRTFNHSHINALSPSESDGINRFFIGMSMAASIKGAYTIDFPIENSDGEDEDNKILFNCEIGGNIVFNPEHTHYGLITSNRLGPEVNIYYDTSCNNWEEFLLTFSACANQNTCEIVYKPSWFDQECIKSKNYEVKGYLKFACRGKFFFNFFPKIPNPLLKIPQFMMFTNGTSHSLLSLS